MHNKIGLHLFFYVLDETFNFSLESYISFYILLLLLILRFLLKLFTEIPVSGDNARIAFSARKSANWIYPYLVLYITTVIVVRVFSPHLQKKKRTPKKRIRNPWESFQLIEGYSVS